MAHTLDMLKTVAPEPTIDLPLLAGALEALADCEQASTACAMAMIGEGEQTVVATRRALDCADVSHATHRVLSRTNATDAMLVRALAEACVVACEGSHVACGEHAEHHGHCRQHSESAGRAVEALRVFLGAMG